MKQDVKYNGIVIGYVDDTETTDEVIDSNGIIIGQVDGPLSRLYLLSTESAKAAINDLLNSMNTNVGVSSRAAKPLDFDE
jgi:hypothetical protein